MWCMHAWNNAWFLHSLPCVWQLHVYICLYACMYMLLHIRMVYVSVLASPSSTYTAHTHSAYTQRTHTKHTSLLLFLVSVLPSALAALSSLHNLLNSFKLLLSLFLVLPNEIIWRQSLLYMHAPNLDMYVCMWLSSFSCGSFVPNEVVCYHSLMYI